MKNQHRKLGYQWFFCHKLGLIWAICTIFRWKTIFDKMLLVNFYGQNDFNIQFYLEKDPRLPSRFMSNIICLKVKDFGWSSQRRRISKFLFSQAPDTEKKISLAGLLFHFMHQLTFKYFPCKKEEAILLFQRPLVIDGAGAPGNKKVPHAWILSSRKKRKKKKKNYTEIRNRLSFHFPKNMGNEIRTGIKGELSLHSEKGLRTDIAWKGPKYVKGPRHIFLYVLRKILPRVWLIQVCLWSSNKNKEKAAFLCTLHIQ